MDEARREFLLSKRAQVGERLAQSAGAELCAGLERLGVQVTTFRAEEAASVLSKLRSLPAKDEGIDWAFISNAVRKIASTDEERDDAVLAALRACTRPTDRVSVYWTPSLPIVRLQSADIAATLKFILDQGPETWLFDGSGRWLIENSAFHQEVAYVSQ